MRALAEVVPALTDDVEPRSFPAFPHEPYSIQLDFMRALYDTIDAGGIGMFESPTGEWLCTLAAGALPQTYGLLMRISRGPMHHLVTTYIARQMRCQHKIARAVAHAFESQTDDELRTCMTQS